MSLKKYFLKTNITYKIYLYYNLYVRHKGFLNRSNYSQWGEDTEITDFFREKENGKFLDIGCFHPYMYNNTYLLYLKGWSGYNIDMNPVSIDLFNIARSRDINICSAISDTNNNVNAFFDDPFSPLNTIDKDFYELSKGKAFVEGKEKIIKTSDFKNISKVIDAEIDFLNIDVEGLDFEVLKQIDIKQLNVKLIAIETHLTNGKKGKNCESIYHFLNEKKYKVKIRLGPTTLFFKTI
tara:strand:- start:58 stop:768 length:711 start_codon:yes stop_codon:yes gene_type:complete